MFKVLNIFVDFVSGFADREIVPVELGFWWKMRRLWELKQTIVLWNVDPRDYAMTDAGQIRAWGESYAPRAGDILLFHDNHPHCIEAVRLLAVKPEFQRDWRFCPLTTWLPQSVATHTQPA